MILVSIGTMLSGAAVTTAPMIPGPAYFESNFKSGDVRDISLIGVGLGTFCTLTKPTGIAFDKAGNLFVARDESGNYAILKYAPDGTSRVFATAGLQRTSRPGLRQSENLYVVNTYGNNILKITLDGASTVFADTNSGVHPADLFFDPAGNLFVTNTYGGPQATGSVIKLSPEGTGMVFEDTGFMTAYGITVDSVGNVFVSNFTGNTVRKFAHDGTDLGIFARSPLRGPHGDLLSMATARGGCFAASVAFCRCLKRKTVTPVARAATITIRAVNCDRSV